MIDLSSSTWSKLDVRLRDFVARRIPDRVAVDDLTQEILVRLYTHYGRLREQERLDAWAYQVARNAIADYWRDRAARREYPFDERLNERLESLQEIEGDEEADRLRGEIASCVAPMVERLAEPYREAIRADRPGKRKQAEAAAELGLSVPGMKARSSGRALSCASSSRLLSDRASTAATDHRARTRLDAGSADPPRHLREDRASPLHPSAAFSVSPSDGPIDEGETTVIRGDTDPLETKTGRAR